MPPKENKFTPEQLYVYRTAPEVLNSLQLMFFDAATAAEISPPTVEEDKEDTSSIAIPSNKEISPSSFGPAAAAADKDYYKSDLYKLNLKREVKGLRKLTEEEFEALIDEEGNESISGSDDSEAESEDDDYTQTKRDVLETIFEKSINQLERLKFKDSDEDEEFVSHLATKSPFILFKSSLLPEDKAFGIYKSLFDINQLQTPLKALKSFQGNSIRGKSAVFMIGGGHFAGAIINHQPLSTKNNIVKPGHSILEQSVEILKHKSFHRYTTRRKQGGSQSASDNANGKANSAGSNLRRHNEAMLAQEVKELIQSWKAEIDQCEFIFIKANGASNRRILVGYENAVIKSDDLRLRTFPFTTKRATMSEVKRAWVELTYLQVVTKPKVNDKKLKQKQIQEEKLKASTMQISRSSTPVLSDEEKHSREIVNYLKKGRGPLLVTYLKKHKLDPNFTLLPESEYYTTPTILHYAASQNLKNLIPTMIKALKVDPTITNKTGKTAYELAANKQIRHVFQTLRFDLGEDFLNWDAAKVGPALDKSELEKQEKEEAAKSEEEKKQAIKDALSRKTEEDIKQEESNARAKKLGSSSLSFSQVNLNSLSDDQRMRVMREQRARAAEARFKAQQQSK